MWQSTVSDAKDNREGESDFASKYEAISDSDCYREEPDDPKTRRTRNKLSATYSLKKTRNRNCKRKRSIQQFVPKLESLLKNRRT